jgi:hypothetical protein
MRGMIRGEYEIVGGATRPATAVPGQSHRQRACRRGLPHPIDPLKGY